MAVEILCLNFDGSDGRKKGTIINIQSAPDDAVITWGNRERPPRFRIIRIEGITESDLPPDYLEYGWRNSKTIVDFSKMTAQEKAGVDNPHAYVNGNAQPVDKKADFAVARVAQLVRDNAVAWAAVKSRVV